MTSAQQAEDDGANMASLLTTLNAKATSDSAEGLRASSSSNTLGSGDEGEDRPRALSRNDTDKFSEALTQEFRKALTSSSNST